MIQYQDVQRLERFHSTQGIVSLYLKIESNLMHERDHPMVQLKGMTKRFVDGQADPWKIEAFNREKDRLMSYLLDWTIKGRGLAIFACAPLRLWEVVNLDVPVPSTVEVDTTPRTKPLLQVLDEHPRFMLVVVQRDHASLYRAHQRQMDKEAVIDSPVHRWHKQEGQKVGHAQRHIQSQVNEHLKKVVTDLENLYAIEPYDRLVIGATESTASELIRMLPDPVAQRVVGTFTIDFKHETEESILQKANQVVVEHERQSEQELVARIMDEARSGGQGVLGVDATLPTILAGRVQTLVIAEGASREGIMCSNCDFLATTPFERCPACGAKAERTPDVIDRAAQKAFLAGAHVETICGTARDRLLEQGGMGALLRY